jgi:hypothetical protein
MIPHAEQEGCHVPLEVQTFLEEGGNSALPVVYFNLGTLSYLNQNTVDVFLRYSDE